MLNPAFSKKWTSQHHNKPLKISGLFLFVTVFVTQRCLEHHKQGSRLGNYLLYQSRNFVAAVIYPINPEPA